MDNWDLETPALKIFLCKFPFNVSMSLQLLLGILTVSFFITALMDMVVVIVPILLAMAYFLRLSVFVQEMGIAHLQINVSVTQAMLDHPVRSLRVMVSHSMTQAVFVQQTGIAPLQINVSVTQAMLDHLVKFHCVTAFHPMTLLVSAQEMGIAPLQINVSVTQAMLDHLVKFHCVTA